MANQGTKMNYSEIGMKVVALGAGGVLSKVAGSYINKMKPASIPDYVTSAVKLVAGAAISIYGKGKGKKKGSAFVEKMGDGIIVQSALELAALTGSPMLAGVDDVTGIGEFDIEGPYDTGVYGMDDEVGEVNGTSDVM